LEPSKQGNDIPLILEENMAEGYVPHASQIKTIIRSSGNMPLIKGDKL
jgi:hypothetical protein